MIVTTGGAVVLYIGGYGDCVGVTTGCVEGGEEPIAWCGGKDGVEGGMEG